jgi:AraC-like DNA-binding protein
MKNLPVVAFQEYAQYTTHQTKSDHVTITERVHPDFGVWRERSIDLGHIHVSEHQTDLTRDVSICFDDKTLKDYVHHCQSLSGTGSVQFHDELFARLTSNTFHSLYVPGQEYLFSMTAALTNIHIAIAKDYYTELLSDSEVWSAEMKKKLHNNITLYTGELTLTPHMAQVIHSIFASQLSGSLKKLLIEARVQELVAMQLHSMTSASARTSSAGKPEVFRAIRDYLDETFLHEHTLKAIARHFGVNEFALKKGFRENFNTTVFDYLLTRRLEHGRELLLNTSQTIQQVSSVVGYKYPNHFSVAFKKQFGISPAQIR